MKPFDIAIAGCGPAGLGTAVALKRIGHRIHLFDQFDEPRPLWSGLMMQPAGLDALDWLGLGDALRSLGAPIDRLFGREVHSGRIVLDVRYEALRNNRRGLAVHRAALFNVLFDHVKTLDVPIGTGVKIQALDRAADRRPVLVTDKGRRFGPFDLVIDALGSRSPLLDEAAAPATRRSLAYGALWTTLPWSDGAFDGRALEQRYERASVMIGVLPVGKRFSADSRQATFFCPSSGTGWWRRRAVCPRWRASSPALSRGSGAAWKSLSLLNPLGGYAKVISQGL